MTREALEKLAGRFADACTSASDRQDMCCGCAVLFAERVQREAQRKQTTQMIEAIERHGHGIQHRDLVRAIRRAFEEKHDAE